MNFTIRVYGVDEAVARFEGIAAAAVNARPAMEEIYLTMLDIEQEAFEKEGARSGFAKWQKNALSTVIRKVKRHMSTTILRESDRLMNAMTTYRSKDAYTRIERDRIIFQPKMTNIPYGRIQQKGGSAGGADIPARQYIRFSKTDQQAFARELVKHLTRHQGPGRIAVSFGA